MSHCETVTQKGQKMTINSIDFFQEHSSPLMDLNDFIEFNLEEAKNVLLRSLKRDHLRLVIGNTIRVKKSLVRMDYSADKEITFSVSLEASDDSALFDLGSIELKYEDNTIARYPLPYTSLEDRETYLQLLEMVPEFKEAGEILFEGVFRTDDEWAKIIFSLPFHNESKMMAGIKSIDDFHSLMCERIDEIIDLQILELSTLLTNDLIEEHKNRVIYDHFVDVNLQRIVRNDNDKASFKINGEYYDVYKSKERLKLEALAESINPSIIIIGELYRTIYKIEKQFYHAIENERKA